MRRTFHNHFGHEEIFELVCDSGVESDDIAIVLHNDVTAVNLLAAVPFSAETHTSESAQEQVGYLSMVGFFKVIETVTCNIVVGKIFDTVLY